MDADVRINEQINLFNSGKMQIDLLRLIIAATILKYKELEV